MGTDVNQPTFKERDWKERKSTGFFYHSETMFEEHWAGPYSHFGLGEDTESMATYKLSPFLGHAPDYIASLYPDTQPFLIEVQGTGVGGAEPDGTITHKFKAKKLEQLGKWNIHDEVVFWLWNDATQTWLLTSYVSLRGMMAQGHATQGLFDGKRPYWSIPVDVIEKLADTERIYAKYS